MRVRLTCILTAVYQVGARESLTELVSVSRAANLIVGSACRQNRIGDLSDLRGLESRKPVCK